MLFNSFHYFLFFPLVVLLFFLIPHKYRWAFLLLASCYFYAVFIPQYLIILFFLILVDYTMGVLIEKKIGLVRKEYLVFSILANIGILFFFKYFNFFNSNLATLANLVHWNYSLKSLAIILPIGLSFHTFQSLSYVIEVYKGRQKAERHLGLYALYVMFFPQLVAGPIERPQNLLPQFREKSTFDVARIVAGLQLIIWGLFKKMVIADNIALVVNNVFDHVGNFNALSLTVATVLFAFQIYCDFSGYSTIAIGSAKVLGINLMVNFKRPYFSASISEFWRRWHISLSSWFRDYLYIPLGGNRLSKFRNYLNLLITFLVSGLWHGANWTYVVWGGINGFYLILEKCWLVFLNNLKITWLGRAIGILITFILVCIGWIFFRANTLGDSLIILKKIFSMSSWFEGFGNFNFSMANLFLSRWNVAVIFFSVLVLLAVDLKLEKEDTLDENWLAYFSGWRKWLLRYLVVFAVLFFGYFGELPFIYFQF